MGKSAKLYKKKPKSLPKQTSSSNKRDNLRYDEDDNISAQVSYKKDLKAAKLEKESKVDKMKATEQAQTVNKPNRLKSKIWKQLDEQRAKAGLPEIATPKEAGIDYLSQWEKKSKR
ncbi:hypothetical protein L7F22_043755 [Adiantum nelumboides]|nr:hypothetical protein [Adiantum nelumboides]